MVIGRQATLRIPVMKGGTFRTTVILFGGFFSVAFLARPLWTSESAQRDALTRLAHSYSEAVMRFRANYAETVVGRARGLVGIITIDQRGLVASFSASAQRIFGYRKTRCASHRWRLMQLLSNLLPKAAKDAPRGSVVDVFAGVHERLVRVVVKDSGPGVPGELHDGVFQRFSKADSSDSRQKGGTELGLAITKELFEYMGDWIGTESTPGAGATFFFNLPIIHLSAVPGETTPSPDTTQGSTVNP